MTDNRQEMKLEAEALIERRLIEHLSAIHSLISDRATVAEIAITITEAFKSGGKILIFGNGGSAADAQHFAGELVGRLYLERKALPAVALSTNTSNLTAISNDFGYESVFARQVEALGSPKDVAIGITTSGNSPNIVAGLDAARRMGLTTIGMTGRNGGVVGKRADSCLKIDTDDTPRCQEAHISAIHIICEWVEKELSIS
ncbi:MAG: D-sedoheptulose 7-phosphate isomerase [Dehalococcoidia bacterium]